MQQTVPLLNWLFSREIKKLRIALLQDFGKEKETGGSMARTADPSWPEGCSISQSIIPVCTVGECAGRG